MVPALIDSGASVNLLSRNAATKLSGVCHESAESQHLAAVNGTRVPHYGTVTLNFRLGCTQFTDTFYLVGQELTVLGFPFLQRNGLDVCASRGLLVRNGTAVCELRPEEQAVGGKAGQPAAIIQRNGVNHCPVNTFRGRRGRPPNIHRNAAPAEITSAPLRTGAITAETVSNIDAPPQSPLQREEEPPVVPSSAEVSCPETLPVVDQHVITQLLKSVPVRFHHALRTLCAKYASLFQGTLSTEVKHDVKCVIELIDSPKMIRPYPIAKAYEEELVRYFHDLIDQGIVEYSSSPTSCPLVVVTKPDGRLRPCVDFRQVNRVTAPDQYPLPKIQDLLQEVRGTVFSSIDLKDAYYQIPTDPASVYLTAVRTPIGVVQYKRMPFGLRNAAAIFQRFIDGVVRDIPFVRAYIDDLVIFSSSPEEHILHLEAVMRTLHHHGLVVNLHKSKFFAANLTFLGFEVSSGGYRPAEKILPKLDQLKSPSTRKELQKVLGTVNFFRGSVPALANILAPIYRLLSPKVKFVWGVEHEKAFQNVRDILRHRPALARFDYDRPFDLFTDASNEAVGAVMLQDDIPVGYFSRRLLTAERNYSTFDRETLAIVKALKHFRVYILGRTIRVHTDHKPLLSWLELPATSPRQARFKTDVLEFDFTIHHVPGHENVLADLLSRPSLQREDFQAHPSGIAQLALDTSDLDAAIREGQTEALLDHCRKFSKRVERVADGIWCDLSTEHPRVIVPPDLRQAVVAAAHNLGHAGIKRTFGIVASRYFWPGMRPDCNAFVRNCGACQRNKPARKPKRAPVVFPHSDRFDVVHVDIVGPLPVSSKGHAYLLTMIDRFSRWLEAVPCASLTAENMATLFLNTWVARFGVPARVISDQGRNFDSALFKRVLASLGCDKVRTTAYHPQSNGMVERSHRTLKESLRCLISTSEDWEACLPLALLALRNAENATGFTSAQLMFGEALRLPVDLVAPPRSTSITDHQALVRELRSTCWLLRHALATSGPSGVQSNRHPPWAFVALPPIRSSLQPRYEGPYKVVSSRGGVLTLDKDGTEVNVSIDNTRPAFGIREPIIRDDSSSSASDDEVNAAVPPAAPLARPRVSRAGRELRLPDRYQA